VPVWGTSPNASGLAVMIVSAATAASTAASVGASIPASIAASIAASGSLASISPASRSGVSTVGVSCTAASTAPGSHTRPSAVPLDLHQPSVAQKYPSGQLESVPQRNAQAGRGVS
jgi:hypothetical protein